MNNYEEYTVLNSLDIGLSKTYQPKKAIGLIHKIYLSQIKSSRKYTASTKTKSEVSGGGRKPWKQKGTGRARAGSTRSPLWVGGGVSFGPKPRIVEKKINKKERHRAVLEALQLKAKQIRFYSGLAYNNGFVSTQKACLLLQNQIRCATDTNQKKGVKTLIVTNKPNRSLWLSTRGLKNVELTDAACLNLRQIVEAKSILIENEAVYSIFSTY